MITDYYLLSKKISKLSKEKDNDLYRIKSPVKSYSRRDIQPTDYTYHDYYYQYMKMNQNLTIHDDLVNFADIDNEYRSPWKKKNGVRTIGYQHRYGEGRMQPIFNNDLLENIDRKKGTTIYSRRK